MNQQLSLRQQYCTVLATICACQRRSHLDRWLERAVRRDNVPPEFLSELFIHLSLTLGFPTLLDAFERLHRLRRTKFHKQSPPALSAGSRIFRRVYGSQADRVLENLSGLHPELPKWILTDTYGKVFSRKGMSLDERELANVIVLAHEGFEKQLYSHVRGALRTGMTPGQLERAIKLSENVGKTRLRLARQMLRMMTKKRID